MTSKVIDVHTHTFPEKIAAHALEVLSHNSHTRPFSDGTVRGLRASMSESGVTLSVIQPVATRPEQVRNINDTAMKINAGESAGIISFGGIHPDFSDWNAELSRIHENGIIGIKIHPVYQGVPVDDERYVRILARAGELGLIVMIPERIVRAIDMAGGNVRVILAHMGGWRCWNDAVRLFTGRKNVYIDTAFSLGKFVPNGDGYYSGGDECMMLRDDEFVKIVRAFGSERVLFGTDSPWASQSDCVRAVMSLELSDDEKKNILCGNALKFLGASIIDDI